MKWAARIVTADIKRRTDEPEEDLHKLGLRAEKNRIRLI